MRVFLSFFFITLSMMGYEATEKNERNPQQISIKGFKDTPKQPAPFSKWHIHDPDRPQPAVTTPKYDGKPVPAPQGAKVLFDGTNLKQWKNKKWRLENNTMTVGGNNQESTDKFKDIHLHIEWKTPVGKKGWGQAQGNSGIYLMGLYEVQILNCWANRTYPDGMTGAIYGQRPPEYNACKKPGEWQSFDIHFKAPVFNNKKLSSPAYITVLLNGQILIYLEHKSLLVLYI